MICAMSERESAGALFVPKTQFHHNGGGGGGGPGGGEQLDTAMSDDVDSEVEDAASFSVFRRQADVDVQEMKRNKRKNFKPRNIFFTEPANNYNEFMEPSEDYGSDEESGPTPNALDLTSGDAFVRGAKKLKLAPTTEQKPETPSKVGFSIEDLTSKSERTPVEIGAGAIDLSSTSAENDAAPSRRCDEYSDSNSCDSEARSEGATLAKERRGSSSAPPEDSAPSPPPPPHHMFLNQPTDASDLKEYAQNTVKELLQIYGLVGDASDVADCIDKSIPMSNFSSGKILETLSVRAAAASGLRSHMAMSAGSPFNLAALHQQHQHQQLQNSLPKSICTTSSSATSLSPSTNSSTNTLVISTDSPRNKLFLENCRPKETTPVNSVKNMATLFAIASFQEKVKAGLSPSSSIDSPSTPVSGPCGSQQQVRQSSSPQLSREGRSAMPVDYSRYVRRFGSSMECGAPHCKDLNYREHFHCLDCNSRVFVKKEEMIRHFKWHKKRDESLQHGFMRYSPSDDCSDRYPGCTHNRKQTHYHCIQGTCDKVYISTSDVQMHANYHRKDSAIIQEGFQRLRATEECRTSYCAFFGQKTTHFHCRRDHCQYTFKNKADMEKHKTYHIKDEQLARDGFKKFLKPDPCGFANCKFSQVINHIHCVRDGCSYVLHSSGQLLSHKRKHERKDSEIAYRKFKLAQQAVINIANNEQISQSSDLSPSSALQFFHPGHSLGALGGSAADCSLSNSSSDGGRMSPPSLTMSLKQSLSPATSVHQQKSSTGFFTDNGGAALDLSNEEQQELWPRYLRHFDSFQTCDAGSKCLFHEFDHFHCTDPSCEMPFRNKEGAENHARVHDTQERFNESFDQEDCQDASCLKEKHFHCTWDGCNEAVLPSESIEHFRSHELAGYNINSLDALFRRKRGRPPKNRIIEIWNDYAGGAQSDSPQAIFTSFKLPKPAPGPLNESAPSPSPTPSSGTNNTSQLADMYGFQEFSETCPDPLCMFRGSQHFHCGRPRCFFATNSDETLVSHAKDFHENIDIMDGFLFFDRSIDCRMESCRNNKMNRHFHCVQPGCGYSFVQYSNMAHHRLQHLGIPSSNPSKSPSKAECDKIEPKTESSIEETNEKENSSQENSQNLSVISSSAVENENTKPTVVKAAGTFYPLCGLSNISGSYPSQTPRAEDEVKREPPASPPQKWGFSELEKLKPHLTKHNPGAIPPHLVIKPEHNNNEEVDETRIPAGLSLVPMPHFDGDMPAHFPGFSAAMAAAVANQHLAMMTSHGLTFMPPTMPALYSSPSGLMFAAPPGFNPHHPMMSNGLLESTKNSMLNSSESSTPESLGQRSTSPQQNMSPEMKKARVQSSMRMLKDEPVPQGYVRFRFNENCQYTLCGYREHQTHFHCMRKDCGYSFCDKTRFVQHTARHERLDTLMGGDFHQYRANVSCGRPECTYTSTLGSAQNKASHFHCLKCEFVCSDTNKVVAHRRQHQKMDSIYAAGFEKFTPSQMCSQPESCPHSGKQTHYHCLKCQYAVLGLSQMTAHKYRHAD